MHRRDKLNLRQPFKAGLRHLGAGVCLLSYLCAASRLFPMGAALVAWLDGEHLVTIVAERGGTNVVLRHDI